MYPIIIIIIDIYYIYYTRTGCLPEQINSVARSLQA